MSYSREEILNIEKERVIDPRSKPKKADATQYAWWLAQNDTDLVAQVLSTMEYLKRTNITRVRQASVFSRLYSGKPLYNFLASNSTLDTSNQLPIGRPTANVCYSCTDTLVSRLSQDRPMPTFLTDGGNYKERKMAEEANAFIQGEIFRTKAYEKVDLMTRDSLALGDGLIKVYKKDKKVCLDRILETELLVDFNDGYYNDPRQMMHPKLVDRFVAMDMFPKAADILEGSVAANVDSTPRSTETISDQLILCEAWHLPSSEGAKDGRHVIVCSNGVVEDEPWNIPNFRIAKLGYNPNLVSYFSQGLIEILMPTQMEIYRMLIVASQSIELMGVPRIYIDELSKILETSFNNRVGTIIKGRGTPPEFINATSNNPEIYQWIQWLIQNSYQMSGLSQLAASGVKPAGLNSGEAQRVFDEIQDSRFARFQRRRQDVFTELSYMMIDVAKEIAEEEGSYTTVYPGKDGTRKVDFKNIANLGDTFIIQCFEESSLPKDPAGRQAKLSEMLAAGEITNPEFRRLSNLPDLKQSDRLAAALEERILFSLDEIIENGGKNYALIAPDPWLLDPTNLAVTLSTNYINLYATQSLEEEKMQLLKDWQTQVLALQQQANPPMAQPAQSEAAGTQLPPTQPPQAPVGPASNVAV